MLLPLIALVLFGLRVLINITTSRYKHTGHSEQAQRVPWNERSMWSMQWRVFGSRDVAGEGILAYEWLWFSFLVYVDAAFLSPMPLVVWCVGINLDVHPGHVILSLLCKEVVVLLDF